MNIENFTHAQMMNVEGVYNKIYNYLKQYLLKNIEGLNEITYKNVYRDINYDYYAYRTIFFNEIHTQYNFGTKQHVISYYKNFFFKDCPICKKSKQKGTFKNVKNYVLACADCIKGKIQTCVFCGNCHFEADPAIDFREVYTKTKWVCNLCYTARTQKVSHRPYVTKPYGSGTGKIIQSNRGWAVEIECYLTNRRTFAQELIKLPDTFGIQHDGSLRSVGSYTEDKRPIEQEIEVITPVLKGIKGEEYLRTLCKSLNKDNNAHVDLTCGLHIHIDMENSIDVEVLKRLLILHWMYEPVIMSFLPSSRRANPYAKSLKNDYNYKKIVKAVSYSELRKLWYKGIPDHGKGGLRKYSEDWNTIRRFGINFYCLLEYGNLEIRYHSGTTNPNKILHWTNLHTRMIDSCRHLLKEKPSCDDLIQNGLTQFGKPRSLSRLTKQLFTMLDLSKGTQEYFLERQKKFKNAPAREVDFIEKEAPEPVEREHVTLEAVGPIITNSANF